MSLLIKNARNLGAQTFRINRVDLGVDQNGKPTGTKNPDYWETANCRDFECPDYLLGWTTSIDTSTDLGKRQAYYIRKDSSREFREEMQGGPEGLVLFRFPPGQKCFRGPHSLPVQRAPIFKNLIPGLESKTMDSDEFFTEWNETVTQIGQSKREV